MAAPPQKYDNEQLFIDHISEVRHNTKLNPLEKAKTFYKVKQLIKSRGLENTTPYRVVSWELQNLINKHGIPHPAGDGGGTTSSAQSSTGKNITTEYEMT